jgi:putative transposase
MNSTTVLRAYKYRLYPRLSQLSFLSQHFGATRFIYNYLLDLRKKSCDQGIRLSGLDCKKMIPTLKTTYPWLRDINSQSLQESAINLEKAYQRFLKKLGDYPKPKKKRRRQSFTVPQRFSIEGNYLFIPKLKTGLYVKFHRPVEGTIKSCNISRDPSGKFFVSFAVEQEIALPKIPSVIKEESIDLGVKDICAFSNGGKVQAPRYLRRSLKKLAKLQRQFCRKVKGSKNRKKARIRVARLQEYVKNQRQNFLHQLSSEIVNENQVIYLEDLHVKGMMQFRPLRLSVADAGMGEFVRQLKYKARWFGKQVVQIDRWYPSSKTCSECGYVNEDLALGDREWTCPECGVRHDRDHNAAKNIMTVGRDTPERALGVGRTPVEKRTSVFSMKDLAAKRRARRVDKSFSEKQEAKTSRGLV